jgi:hypothetical protein
MFQLKEDLWVEESLTYNTGTIGGHYSSRLNEKFWHISCMKLNIICEIVPKPNGNYSVSFYVEDKLLPIKRTNNSARKERYHAFSSLIEAKKFGEKKIAKLLDDALGNRLQEVFNLTDRYFKVDKAVTLP